MDLADHFHKVGVTLCAWIRDIINNSCFGMHGPVYRRLLYTINKLKGDPVSIKIDTLI